MIRVLPRVLATPFSPRAALIRAAPFAVFTLACSVNVVLWVATNPGLSGSPWITIALIAALVLSNFVSLPLDRGARLWISSIPCFLIAATLAPAAAMAAMGLGMGIKEIAVCRRCGNTASQVAGQVGRWMFLAVIGSALCHLGPLLLTGAFLGIFLWIGDILTAPLVLSAGTIWFAAPYTISGLMKTSWSGEFMQYLSAYFVLPVFVDDNNNLFVVLLTLVLISVWIVLCLLLLRPVRSGRGVGAG
jgi:hypothetical protein